jgi:HAD superfamily hydrolase (TIGR01549 family)
VNDLVVTFDAGQTLVELDAAMLARRLGERGVTVAAAAIDAASGPAWARYDAEVGKVPNAWKVLMDALLAGAGVAAGRAALVDWLWDEQPRANLWRRPVAGMIELVDRLRAAGVRVGVLSNSEGALADLFDEIGWRGRFDAILDSGVIGIEKPDPRIFTIAAHALRSQPISLVHIGDSRPADIDGVLAVAGRGVWFGRAAADGVYDEARVRIAHDAAGVEAALRAFGVG